jgi:hypothetical protein
MLIRFLSMGLFDVSTPVIQNPEPLFTDSRTRRLCSVQCQVETPHVPTSIPVFNYCVIFFPASFRISFKALSGGLLWVLVDILDCFDRGN